MAQEEADNSPRFVNSIGEGLESPPTNYDHKKTKTAEMSETKNRALRQETYAR